MVWSRTSNKFFVQRLLLCEQMIHQLPTYAQEFIRDLRTKYESRQDAINIGTDQWEPSAKQLNYLSSIADKP